MKLEHEWQRPCTFIMFAKAEQIRRPSALCKLSHWYVDYRERNCQLRGVLLKGLKVKERMRSTSYQ